MKKILLTIAFAVTLATTAFAQDYDAMYRYMKKYSSNWCNKMTLADSQSQLGTKMPDYSFSKTLNSKALSGKTVVMTFWATWCGVALAAWIIDVAPRQGIKADLPTVGRLLGEKHYDRALYLLEQMPLDTLSIAQRWKAMLNVSSRNAMELHAELKKKYQPSGDDVYGMFKVPAPEYVTMMKALAEEIYNSDTTDPEVLKMGREAASVAANFGGFKGSSPKFISSELTLRYARAVYRRAAMTLVNTLGYARKDNDQQKVEAIKALLAKYGIVETDYVENNRDHQRMEQDEREQQEHMKNVSQ